jgi:hypothetical protein
MAETLTKQTLLDSLRAERANLEAALDGLTGDHLITPGVQTDWSVRDVVGHILFWEQRALFLLKSARDGYSEQDDIWKGHTVDSLNAKNYDNHRNRPAPDVLDEEQAVYNTVVRLIEAAPERDLIESGRFEWVSASTLYDHVSGETFEHYRDHLDALRAWRAKMLTS